MESKPNDLKLGTFVLVGFGLLCAGLFAFGAVTYFQRTNLVETYVSGNVDGLSIGAPVTLRGVKVGKVTKIDFSWNLYSESEPRYVIIEFEVRRSIAPAAFGQGVAERIQSQVRSGLRARVNAQGFTGSSLLSLEYMNPVEYPPPPFPWTPRNLCIPSAPSQFAEVLTSLQQTLQKAAQIDFASLAGSLQRDLDSAERLMVRLEGDLGGAEKLIGHLDEVNYKALATNAEGLITQLRGDLCQMRLAKLSNDADELLGNANGTIRHLDLVVANLDAGSLNDALANIRLATKDLDETLRKLKQYPAGFLFGKPPAPVSLPQKHRNENSKSIMKRKIINPLLPALFLITLGPALTVTAGSDLRAEAEIAIRNLQSADSTLTNLFSSSAGYAVFARVGKAGLILGAEHGKGIVYEKGKPIGEAALTEINVGPQVGGEAFYEIIFFETAEALADFKERHFEMSAKVSAVAAAEGAALNAKYQEGVIVFTMPRSGLMAQVAIGGQKFRFEPWRSLP